MRLFSWLYFCLCGGAVLTAQQEALHHSLFYNSLLSVFAILLTTTLHDPPHLPWKAHQPSTTSTIVHNSLQAILSASSFNLDRQQQLRTTSTKGHALQAPFFRS